MARRKKLNPRQQAIDVLRFDFDRAGENVGYYERKLADARARLAEVKATPGTPGWIEQDVTTYEQRLDSWVKRREAYQLAIEALGGTTWSTTD